MIPKQVYRRGDLHVEFPELDKVSITQPFSEFRTSRKYFGNKKNEGSPEFRVGPFSGQNLRSESTTKQRPIESEKTLSTEISQNPEEGETKKELEFGENSEIGLLREELRRKEEEIRRLLEYDRSRTPVPPPRRLDTPSNHLTPLQLYQLSQSKTPTSKRIDMSFEKQKSLSPMRPGRPSQGLSPSPFYRRVEGNSLHDLARLPLFQQPKYTTKNPKVCPDSKSMMRWSEDEV